MEACIYAIEVKSGLTSGELDDAITKSQKIWLLKPLVEGIGPRPAVFAFGSDLTEKTELDRYLEKDPAPYRPPITSGFSMPTWSWGRSKPLNPACCAMCVVGRSYHYWDHANQSWGGFSATGKFDEVLRFLAEVADGVSFTFHRKELCFSQYLIP